MPQNSDSWRACRRCRRKRGRCRKREEKIRKNVSPLSFDLVFHLRSHLIVYPVLCLVHRQFIIARWNSHGNGERFGEVISRHLDEWLINLSLSIYHRFYVLNCTSGLKTDVKKFISCFLTSLWSTFLSHQQRSPNAKRKMSHTTLATNQPEIRFSTYNLGIQFCFVFCSSE